MDAFPLAAALRPLYHALRRHDALQGAAWGSVVGLGVALILALAARSAPLWTRPTLLTILGPLLLLCPLWSALLSAFRPLRPASRLRRLERALRLAERLTTAWELHTGRIAASAALQTAQREETARSLEAIHPHRAFPARPPKTALLLAGGLLLALLPALLLPNPQEHILAQRAALQQAAELEAARIEALAESVRQLPNLSPAEREALLQSLETARQTLLDPTASNEARQAALLEAEQQLAALQNTPDLAAEALAAALASAPLDPPSNANARALVEALQRGDLAAAEAQLHQLAAADALTQEEQLALAESLAQLADAAQPADPALAEALETAAEALAAEADSSALEALAETLAQREAAAAATQAALETLQAGLQSGRERLGAAQRQAQSAAPGASPALSQQGGVGDAFHSEDSGSAAPYGPSSSARLEETGSEITLPRPVTADGVPVAGPGVELPARVPYRELYPAYAEAAAAALSRQPLPPGLRTAIHTYFSALAPEGAALNP